MTDALPAGRLHPWSWVFHAIRALREVALPALVFMVVGRKDAFGPLVVGAVAAIMLIAWGILRSRTFRYELLERELLVREGFFVRETRHVPFARVQAVNERQGPLHRLLGVTELVLESGAAGKPEAVMRVLGVAEAARIAGMLRSVSTADHATPDVVASPAAAATQELLRIPTDELILHGIISNRGFVVIALAFGILSQNRELLDLLPIDFKQLMKDSTDTAAGIDAGAILGVLLALLLGFVVLVRLLSIAFALFTLHDFTLRRAGDRLRMHRGLLSRVDVSGRVSGFQRIVLEQSLLHRAFRRCVVKVDLAGASLLGTPEAADSRLDTLAPIATPARARSLLQELVPGLDLEAMPWQPLHRSAAVRRWQRTMWWLLPTLTLVVAAAGLIPGLPSVALPGALVAATLGLGLSVMHAWQWARWSAFAASDGVIAFRSGAWARQWTLVFDDRAQSTALRRSPRDRREGTASLAVDVQSMTVSQALHIPYLDAALGERLNARFWRAGTSAPLPADAHAGSGLR
ncbi:MAG: PH domain-containing protein [Proteobacteria bacterium]|nr:PH domain-containing protein [Pseudomonadota bacterium]